MAQTPRRPNSTADIERPDSTVVAVVAVAAVDTVADCIASDSEPEFVRDVDHNCCCYHSDLADHCSRPKSHLQMTTRQHWEPVEEDRIDFACT